MNNFVRKINLLIYCIQNKGYGFSHNFFIETFFVFKIKFSLNVQ